MRILIIRHGDPDYEHDTLTEKGHREAKLLADRLKDEKIDYFYSSPLGRAKDTCMYVARAHGREQDVIVKDWLKEFGCHLFLPSGRERGIPWDMLTDEWVDNPQMYDYKNWYIAGDTYDTYHLSESPVHYTHPNYKALITIKHKFNGSRLNTANAAFSLKWYEKNALNQTDDWNLLKRHMASFFREYDDGGAEYNG